MVQSYKKILTYASKSQEKFSFFSPFYKQISMSKIFCPSLCRAQLFILLIYIQYFLLGISLSIIYHFRDHLAIILNVTVGFLSLFYLFLFTLTLFL